MRYRGPPNASHCRRRPVSRRLLQGGVLSPFLWFLHINPIRQHLDRVRASKSSGSASLGRLALLVADDATEALPLGEPMRSTLAANAEASIACRAPKVIGLSSKSAKSSYFALSQIYSAGSHHRKSSVEATGGCLDRNTNLALLPGAVGDVPINCGARYPPLTRRSCFSGKLTRLLLSGTSFAVDSRNNFAMF